MAQVCHAPDFSSSGYAFGRRIAIPQLVGGDSIMTSLVVLWLALGIATAGLALYRKFVSFHEEDFIHLAAGEESHIPEQFAMAHKLDLIDTWGKRLTVVTVVLGLAVAGVYLFQAWQASLQPFH
jgi:hypothetical protein